MPETGNSLVIPVSFYTPKCTLVPQVFFNEEDIRSALSSVVKLQDNEKVHYVELPEYEAVLLYSSVSGSEKEVELPELYYLLKDLNKCKDYNKILVSYKDGFLNLVIAQGERLLFCNVFDASYFTTAEYFIFLTMNKLQLNPEVSTICFRTPLSDEEKFSLYRYFKAVDRL
ncbi:MAG: DUF3822 family protein [Candidatus Cryptobacteroides sp.]